jgi:hypothetical protein
MIGPEAKIMAKLFAAIGTAVLLFISSLPLLHDLYIAWESYLDRVLLGK